MPLWIFNQCDMSLRCHYEFSINVTRPWDTTMDFQPTWHVLQMPLWIFNQCDTSLRRHWIFNQHDTSLRRHCGFSINVTRPWDATMDFQSTWQVLETPLWIFNRDTSLRRHYRFSIKVTSSSDATTDFQRTNNDAAWQLTQTTLSGLMGPRPTGNNHIGTHPGAHRGHKHSSTRLPSVNVEEGSDTGKVTHSLTLSLHPTTAWPPTRSQKLRPRLKLRHWKDGSLHGHLLRKRLDGDTEKPDDGPWVRGSVKCSTARTFHISTSPRLISTQWIALATQQTELCTTRQRRLCWQKKKKKRERERGGGREEGGGGRKRKRQRKREKRGEKRRKDGDTHDGERQKRQEKKTRKKERKKREKKRRRHTWRCAKNNH